MKKKILEVMLLFLMFFAACGTSRESLEETSSGNQNDLEERMAAIEFMAQCIARESYSMEGTKKREFDSLPKKEKEKYMTLFLQVQSALREDSGLEQLDSHSVHIFNNRALQIDDVLFADGVLDFPQELDEEKILSVSHYCDSEGTWKLFLIRDEMEDEFSSAKNQYYLCYYQLGKVVFEYSFEAFSNIFPESDFICEKVKNRILISEGNRLSVFDTETAKLEVITEDLLKLRAEKDFVRYEDQKRKEYICFWVNNTKSFPTGNVKEDSGFSAAQTKLVRKDELQERFEKMQAEFRKNKRARWTDFEWEMTESKVRKQYGSIHLPYPNEYNPDIMITDYAGSSSDREQRLELLWVLENGKLNVYHLGELLLSYDLPEEGHWILLEKWIVFNTTTRKIYVLRENSQFALWGEDVIECKAWGEQCVWIDNQKNGYFACKRNGEAAIVVENPLGITTMDRVAVFILESKDEQYNRIVNGYYCFWP